MCRKAHPLGPLGKGKNNNVIVPTRNLVTSISSLYDQTLVINTKGEEENIRPSNIIHPNNVYCY